MVVVGLGYDFLFKSLLAHCVGDGLLNSNHRGTGRGKTAGDLGERVPWVPLLGWCLKSYHLVAEQVEHFGTFVLEAVVLDLQAFESIGYLWFHLQRLRGHPSTNNVLLLKFPKFDEND